MNRANTLRTTLELQVMFDAIEDLKTALFRQNVTDIQQLLQSAIPEKVYEYLNNNYDLSTIMTKEALDQTLTELKTQLEKLRPVHVTIAIDPTDELIEEIFQAVSENWGDGYILNITIDRDIIGGSIIIIDGHYYDFSLEEKIDQYLKENNPLTTTQTYV